MLGGKRILLIVGGGIAAYKCLDLIRRLRERDAIVRCVVTRAAINFVTPMSLQALSENKVYQDMFSLSDESEMGHIQLSRAADLLVVAPATADLLARMAAGLADDLASTVLLATDKPVLAAPAMNLRMWLHAATQENVATLRRRGIAFVGPNQGAMACNEFGPGRMAEPNEIVVAIGDLLSAGPLNGPTTADTRRGTRPLAGRRALVTSGPTREPLDPVRFLSNHSSGKQGHAIADALAKLGATVTLVTGPVAIANPGGVEAIRVETADDMLTACQKALPVDVAICAAAVADWKAAKPAGQKLKKIAGEPPPSIALTTNPDILATLARPGKHRPSLVVGFAAETDDVVAKAAEKRARKGCDWIFANDVSALAGTFGSDHNVVHLITAGGAETWPKLSKVEIGRRIAERVSGHFSAAAIKVAE